MALKDDLADPETREALLAMIYEALAAFHNARAAKVRRDLSGDSPDDPTE